MQLVLVQLDLLSYLALELTEGGFGGLPDVKGKLVHAPPDH
jgi:hypothetical protein